MGYYVQILILADVESKPFLSYSCLLGNSYSRCIPLTSRFNWLHPLKVERCVHTNRSHSYSPYNSDITTVGIHSNLFGCLCQSSWPL